MFLNMYISTYKRETKVQSRVRPAAVAFANLIQIKCNYHLTDIPQAIAVAMKVDVRKAFIKP